MFCASPHGLDSVLLLPVKTVVAQGLEQMVQLLVARIKVHRVLVQFVDGLLGESLNDPKVWRVFGHEHLAKYA